MVRDIIDVLNYNLKPVTVSWPKRTVVQFNMKLRALRALSQAIEKIVADSNELSLVITHKLPRVIQKRAIEILKDRGCTSILVKLITDARVSNACLLKIDKVMVDAVVQATNKGNVIDLLDVAESKDVTDQVRNKAIEMLLNVVQSAGQDKLSNMNLIDVIRIRRILDTPKNPLAGDGVLSTKPSAPPATPTAAATARSKTTVR